MSPRDFRNVESGASPTWSTVLPPSSHAAEPPRGSKLAGSRAGRRPARPAFPHRPSAMMRLLHGKSCCAGARAFDRTQHPTAWENGGTTVLQVMKRPPTGKSEPGWRSNDKENHRGQEFHSTALAPRFTDYTAARLRRPLYAATPPAASKASAQVEGSGTVAPVSPTAMPAPGVSL